MRSPTGRNGGRGARRGEGPRVVQCYHCRTRFEVSQKAESIGCPSCSQRVIVGDVVVRELRPVSRVQTCGRIVVHEKARVNAEVVEAHEGVEVFGGLSGNVLSGGPVIIGPKARWAGDCRAPSVEIHVGARIERGRFIVPDHSLGLFDLPGYVGPVPAPPPPRERPASDGPGAGGDAPGREAGARSSDASKTTTRKGTGPRKKRTTRRKATESGAHKKKSSGTKTRRPEE